MTKNKKRLLLAAIILYLSIVLPAETYSKNIFRRTPKVQVYDHKRKELRYRDKVQKFDAQWQEILTQDVYAITRKKGTEIPYSGKYWNNHEKGIYRCACCGIDLFSSEEKFDHGDGMASFYKPVIDTNVLLKKDLTRSDAALQVLCVRCDAHLGFLFSANDDFRVRRFSINSVSLVFEREPQEP